MDLAPTLIENSSFQGFSSEPNLVDHGQRRTLIVEPIPTYQAKKSMTFWFQSEEF